MSLGSDGGLLYKMLNVLQTCPYKFLHVLKLKCFKDVCPMNLDFLGVDVQTPYQNRRLCENNIQTYMFPFRF